MPLYAPSEHPEREKFYADAMKRGGKKKKKASKRDPTLKAVQKVSIRIGGEKTEMGKLYSALHSQMGGSGSNSSAMFPSTPSYYRLAAPSLNQAIPAPLNMAIPNNLVNPLFAPTPLHQGSSSHRSEDVIPPQPTSQSMRTNLHVYDGSSPLVHTAPEPNRPVSAVFSERTAGRPIVADPDLPRQRPTGRDNYQAPRQGQLDAPRSGYFPQRGQQPKTRESEYEEDSEVGSSKRKNVGRGQK